MSEKKIVNSKDYWEKRFTEDWESEQGPSQSRFFARLALSNLPSWLFEKIKSQRLTVADWGCAQGDGTNVLASVIDAEQLTGIDFSDVAVDQAKDRYQKIRFVCENWLDKKSRKYSSYDVVFSSNTLEHFQRPHEVLKRLSEQAEKAIVLALPFRELDRIDEHFCSFFLDNISIELPNGFRLVWSRVVDCRRLPDTLWDGEQIFLVYVSPSWLTSLSLTLADSLLEHQDSVSEIVTLNQNMIHRDGQIMNLNHALAERDRQIMDLNYGLAERDGQIASLNNAVSDRIEQIASLKMEIEKIKTSTSWTITRPVRFVKQLIQSPKRTSYSVAKFIFWKLPPYFRQKLHGPRHYFIRFVKGLPAFEKKVIKIKTASDLTWNEFLDQVVSRRTAFKGIFVQELVIDWKVSLYQRPQHIASALGRNGYLVIYRTDNWAGDDVEGFREVEKNVWITNRYEVCRLEGVVRSLYSTAYANTPELIMEGGRRGTLVYEYIDHISSEISGDRENVKRLQALKDFAFGGGADFIVASAKKLYDEAVEAVGEDRVVLIPNGVDTRHYRDPKHLSVSLTDGVVSFRKKFETIIGYFGALAPWLWYDAIEELVNQRTDLGFLFIGPDYYGGALKLPSSENVLYVGPVDYKILPAYALQFDVCLIPFKPGDIAKTTSPLKLFEYFALEKPVVVTSDMLECVAFREVFRGDSVIALSKAIDEAIAVKDSQKFKKRLAQLADENDWDQRARSMEIFFGPKQ